MPKPFKGGVDKLFKRGIGPLVSIIIATRKRVPQLLEAVDSCWGLAVDKSLLEFVFKVDDDDLDTIRAVERIATKTTCQMIISPRERGYLSQGEWNNAMGERAAGDWLFLFSDDARMVTQGWDQILLNTMDSTWHGTGEMLLLAPTLQRFDVDDLLLKIYAYEFPFLRRSTFQALGHWGDPRWPYSDNWIWHVMNMVGSAMISTIYIEHLQNMDDEVRRESTTSIEDSGIDWNHPEAVRGRIEDAGRLLDHIEAKMGKGNDLMDNSYRKYRTLSN